jgi:hypothetical protein
MPVNACYCRYGTVATQSAAKVIASDSDVGTKSMNGAGPTFKDDIRDDEANPIRSREAF